MAKYHDKTKCKSEAEIIQYKGGEGWKKRHKRRLDANKEYLDKFRNWCEKKGFTFNIFNNNEHWQVKSATKVFDWWPRSAKLIINQQWKKGIHVHDYTQLIECIENYNI
jgi:hypothetical protein